MCVFLQYRVQQKGYRCYDLIVKRFCISRHVTFSENTPYYSLSKKSISFTETPLSVGPFPESPLTESSHVSSTPVLLPVPVPLLDTPTEPVSDCSNANNSMPQPDSACPNNGPTTQPTWDRRPSTNLLDYFSISFHHIIPTLSLLPTNKLS